MMTLTRGVLAVDVIAELLHQRADAGQNALDLRRVSFFPFLLLRSTVDDARGPCGKRRAASCDRFIERQIEPLEHFAEHLDRAVEDVLVAQPNPQPRGNLARRVERKTIRPPPRIPTHCAAGPTNRPRIPGSRDRTTGAASTSQSFRR